MLCRRFGKTNLHLSVFSLGTMRYLVSEEVAVETVRQAVAMGVNHIETAGGYGKSEQYLGKALSAGLQKDRSQLYITTKIPPTADGDLWERKIDESLERLNLDYIDCLAIHGINTQEHLDAAVAGMSGLAKAKSDRRVRHIGFSTHAPLEIILAAINTDLFEFVNLHYYYFFQRNAPAVELAARKDLGVFIISPADKGGQLYTPPETLEELCQPFSPLELNYRFLLSDRRVTTVSVGAANAGELELPLKSSDRTRPLTAAEMEAFRRLESSLGERLGSDKCSQCYACLPCPEGINIPEVLRLRNLAIAYDMTEFGKYRYRMFENAGHWFWGNKGNKCTNCGDCLPRCPEELDIPALLKDTHQRLKTSEGRRLWE
ncbi:MAG: aldo/keto reductase [Cyanobacteriota bacterium]|nr:aldo/keto reductase [Cyanobacteriota bacterium]